MNRLLVSYGLRITDYATQSYQDLTPGRNRLRPTAYGLRPTGYEIWLTNNAYSPL